MFEHISWPARTRGSPHSSVASCRTVAGSRMVNPAGSTARTCRFAGRVDSLKVIVVSLGISRHMATRAAAPAGIITPPGFTVLADGGAVARAAPAGPPGAVAADPADPGPATVFPQAASPIIKPAAMPPSAARAAAPFGLPNVIIATPSHRRAWVGAPRSRPPRLVPGGSTGPARPPRTGPAALGRALGLVRPARRGVLVRAARLPRAARTDFDGLRHHLVPARRDPPGARLGSAASTGSPPAFCHEDRASQGTGNQVRALVITRSREEWGGPPVPG